MATCEECWAAASFTAAVRGGSVVDWYKVELEKNEGKPGHD